MGYYGELPYGAGRYKGVSEFSTEVINDIALSPSKKCLTLGVDLEHGGGWSERSGANWIWPESPASVASLFTQDNLRCEVVLDALSGLFYIVDPTDSIENNEEYKDKVDPLVPGSGTDIEWDISFGEVKGEKQHYTLSNLDLMLAFRYVDKNNIDDEGYNANGLPDNFAVDVSISQDGKLTKIAESLNVPIDDDINLERETDGKSIQVHLHGNKSEFKFTAIEQYIKVNDRKRVYSQNSADTESQNMEILSSPVVWIVGETGLVNRCTGRLLAGSIDSIASPDGNNNAFLIASPVSIGNSSFPGTLMLWYKTGYTIPGLSLVEVDDSNGWILGCIKGPIPQNIILPEGDVFDVRFYRSTISDTVLNYYFDNITKHSGDKVLP